MKTLFNCCLPFFLMLFIACSKDETQPAFVGKWLVQAEYRNPDTGDKFENGALFPFRMELNEKETGVIQSSLNGDRPFEWDLIDDDRSIVLTGKGIDPASLFLQLDSSAQALIYHINEQSESGGVWVSDKGYFFHDTMSGTLIPYNIRLTLSPQ
ncbi:MAG: hypothetical protein IT259_10240 [Saprospiraceae bacterium]|nr:hypothetical protein [Saprospiraceae bacterium]